MGKKIILFVCICLWSAVFLYGQDQGYVSGMVGAVQSAYEASAKSILNGISTACEMFMAENGAYPGSLDALTGGEKGYLPDKTYAEGVNGYRYSYQRTATGYTITATPLECGKTGAKILVKESSGVIAEKDCR